MIFVVIFVGCCCCCCIVASCCSECGTRKLKSLSDRCCYCCCGCHFSCLMAYYRFVCCPFYMLPPLSGDRYQDAWNLYSYQQYDFGLRSMEQPILCTLNQHLDRCDYVCEAATTTTTTYHCGWHHANNEYRKSWMRNRGSIPWPYGTARTKKKLSLNGYQ